MISDIIQSFRNFYSIKKIFFSSPFHKISLKKEEKEAIVILSHLLTTEKETKNMKKIVLAALFAMLAAFTFAQNAKTPQFAIVKDGKPIAKVYTPANSNRISLLAAQELISHIEAISGARLPIAFNEPDHFAWGRPRFVQILLEVRPEAEWREKGESAQAYTITGNNKLANHDALIIRGNTSIALLYGVYDYLESLGVRFYAPGDNGTVIPQMKDIYVPVGVKTVSPAVARRQMNLAGTDGTHFALKKDYTQQEVRDYTTWYLRNRLQLNRNIDSGDYPFIHCLSEGGSHGISGARDQADFNKEPERFPMVNGKRVKGGQICWTNKKNLETAGNNANEFFDKVGKNMADNDLKDIAKIKDISLFDWGGALCECPECTKIAGNDPNKLDRLVWSFINKVAEKVAEHDPEAKLSIFAPYLQLTNTPADVKIKSNIYAMACRSEAWEGLKEENLKYYPFTKFYEENVLSNVKAGAKLAVYEYIMWQGSPQSCDVLDAIAKYRKIGTDFYTCEVMQRNDMLYPITYSMAHSLFFAGTDPHKTLEEYCLTYFGKENGEKALQLYIDITENAKKLERRIYGDLPTTSAIMDEALVAKYRKSLYDALGKTTDKVLKERFERFVNAFETASMTAEIYRAHCDALEERTEKAADKVKEKIAAFKAFIPKVERYASPGDLTLCDPMLKLDYKNPKLSRAKDLDDNEKYMEALYSRVRERDTMDNLVKLPEYWLFKLDPRLTGNAEEYSKETLPNKEKWHKISTWDCFESQDYYECGGQFWYRLEFDAQEFPKGKRVFIRIGAIDDTGEYYLNGKKFGESLSSSNWDLSMKFDITDYIKKGKNIMLFRGYDAFGGGGLWRPCAIYTE